MFAPGTVLLHDSLTPGGTSLWFEAPRRVLVAHGPETAAAALAELETAAAAGLWAAGFMAYELGYLFEERLRPLLPAPADGPLLWFGLYEQPERLTADEVDHRLAAFPPGAATGLVPDWDEQRHARAFATVHAAIEAGDVYQVNLTFPARFRLAGDAVGLYRALVARQPAAHGALVFTGEQWIVSRSPELFVECRNNVLSARPMKGTVPRGATPAEDAARREALAADEKNRAENLMIVDLLRNDLGRVATPGSVAVTDLYTVETYPTLHTLTSGITARRRPRVGTGELLAALFPCGSITGAPKIRAMEIIRAVEDTPRGVYTGSVGFFAPGGDLRFSVAIRTAVIDRHGNGRIGIGGGIVADSTAPDEYREALLKMTFLEPAPDAVTLIETLLWEEGSGYALLDRHLHRLEASAAVFGIAADRPPILALLDEQRFDAPRMRVRLTLDAAGPAVTATPLPPNPPLFRFAIAPEPLQSTSLWVRHKTTTRSFYDEPRQRAHAALGVDEVVFLNEHGLLTEGSITNLFIKRGGRLLTPGQSAGLLPGTLRAELIAQGRAVEADLRLADLAAADAIWLGNSVRGLIRAEWVRTEGDRA